MHWFDIDLFKGMADTDALALMAAVETMTSNFHAQFHEIFPPEAMPTAHH
ncbi:MAG TPA: hypothetical protein VF460_13360 [Burkholderiales bacterium]